MVGTHVRREMGVMDSEWDWGSVHSWKAGGLCALVDWCLAELRVLVCVLFQAGEQYLSGVGHHHM